MDSIDGCYADKGKYPASLDVLVTEAIRQVPKDPLTNSADTWQTIPAEPDASDPTAELGIVDVKSGSEGASIDGTRYDEW